MSVPRQYCGECFALFEAAADVCPLCSAIASRLSERNYEQKLLHALEHPLPDVRLRAIISIARRAWAGAAYALSECALRHPTDVVQGLAIVDGLLRIAYRHRETVGALQRLAEEHPARVIRKAVRAGLAKLERQLSFDEVQPT